MIVAGRKETTGKASVRSDPLAAALCCAGGLQAQALERSFTEEALDRAWSKWRGGLTLHQLLAALACRGKLDVSPRDVPEQLPQVLEAAFSTDGSASDLLSNVGGKWMHEGFGLVEDTWRLMACVRPARDLKALKSYRLTDSFTFEPVVTGNPLPARSVREVGAGSYANQAKLYGTMFVVDLPTLLNDDLDAFAEVFRRVGMGAALTVNQTVWATLAAAVPSLFTSGNGNLLSGASSGLSAASLASAEALLAAQKYASAPHQTATTTMALTPWGLIVPAGLRHAAQNLVYQRSYVGADGAWRGGPTVGASAYLTNPAAWLLTTDPRVNACVELAFLNGQEEPTIVEAGPDATFATLNIAFRGAFAFGAAPHEGRAAVYSTGA